MSNPDLNFGTIRPVFKLKCYFPQVFNDYGSVLSCQQTEFSQNITLIDHWQNRSIANPNCEKIRLGMMNLTVPNGSKAGDDSNDGDDHANAI